MATRKTQTAAAETAAAETAAAETAAAETVAAAEYSVIEPLLHNGTKYMPGKPIELTATEFAAMKAKGLVGKKQAEDE